MALSIISKKTNHVKQNSLLEKMNPGTWHGRDTSVYNQRYSGKELIHREAGSCYRRSHKSETNPV